MIKVLVSIPFISYFLLMPYAALVGNKALNGSAIEEWFVIMGLLTILYVLKLLLNKFGIYYDHKEK